MARALWPLRTLRSARGRRGIGGGPRSLGAPARAAPPAAHGGDEHGGRELGLSPDCPDELNVTVTLAPDFAIEITMLLRSKGPDCRVRDG